MSSTNLTVDDTSTDIVYSPDWLLQSADDQTAQRFFSSTYHAAQADGATANISFTGSAIYLYGTRGPGHANYSVLFDRFIVFLSAKSSETSFRQPLFIRQFNVSGRHLVSLTVIHDESAQWFDLDYVTITVNGSAVNSSNAAVNSTATADTDQSSSTPTATMTPPWLLSDATSENPTGTGGEPQTTIFDVPTSSSAASTSSTHRVTLTLAIVFGTIIAIAIALISILLFCKRRHERQRKREHAFRYGEAIRHLQRQEEMQRQQMLHPATTPATLVVPEQYRSDDETEVTQTRLDGGKHMLGQTFSQSSDSVLPPDPFARDMMKVDGIPVAVVPLNDGLDRDHDRPRPRSPWSMLSNAATTVLTVRSPSPQSTGTNTMLLGRSNAPSHIRPSADAHHFVPVPLPIQTNLRTSSQMQPSQDSLLDESANALPPLPVRSTSLNFSTNLLRRISGSIPQQPAPPAVPLPPAPPNPPPAPTRPTRPKEGLLDWLGTGVADMSVFSRRRDRDDGNSSRTDFLKV